MTFFKRNLQEESGKSHLVKYFTFGFVGICGSTSSSMTSSYRLQNLVCVWDGLRGLDENQTMFTSSSTVINFSNALFPHDGKHYINRNDKWGAGPGNPVFGLWDFYGNFKYVKQNITLPPSNLCSTWNKVVSVSAQHSLQKLIKNILMNHDTYSNIFLYLEWKCKEAMEYICGQDGAHSDF